MTNPVAPSEGLGVLHLFFKLSDSSTGEVDRDRILAALTPIDSSQPSSDPDLSVISVAMLGHKAELAVMALSPDLWTLRALQTELVGAGLQLVDSYLSLTELSEYAAGLPEEMKQNKLYPQLPPEGKSAWCFYPMSKRRQPGQNWFTTPFDERKQLMSEHGVSGRKFAGRIVQLITGSTGLDDYEWGVTLFGRTPDDLKEVVYTMRFDAASADFAEFGRFYSGVVAEPAEVLDRIGLVS